MITELKEVSLTTMLRKMPVIRVAAPLGINHRSLYPTFQAAIQFNHDFLVAIPSSTSITMKGE